MAGFGRLLLPFVVAPVLMACGSAFSAASQQTDDAGADALTDAGPGGGADGRADAGEPEDAADGAAATDAADGTCACADDLSNVGDADFYIAFKITTTSTAQAPILNQRAECDAAKPFWAVALLANGQINVETNDAMGNYGQMHSSAVVNDGAPHHVLISRKGTVVAVDIDGQSASATVPQASLGALAQLQVGTETSCSAPPLSGTVETVCLSTPCQP